MLSEGCPYIRPTNNQVENTGWYAAAMNDLGQGPGACRNEFCGLEYDGVAEGQRRRDLPGGNPKWEIPWGNQPDNTYRSAHHLHIDAIAQWRQSFPTDPQSLAREELEQLPGAMRLCLCFIEGLPLFAGQQAAKLFSALDKFRTNAVQNLRADARAAARP